MSAGATGRRIREVLGDSIASPQPRPQGLLHRLEQSAADQELHQPGGGCAQDLLDAAAAIRRLRDMLYAAGEGVSTHHLTGSDTYRCAFCESDTIRGLPQRHEADCRLVAVKAEFDEAA